jgi:hypothetical protein
MLLNIFAIVIGIIVIIGAIFFMRKGKKLREEGIEAEGVVFDTEQSTINNSSISNPIIRFTTEKNEWITAKSNTGVIPRMYKKGDKVIVIYQKENPSYFVIKDNTTKAIPYILIIIAFVVMILGIYGLVNVQFQ